MSHFLWLRPADGRGVDPIRRGVLGSLLDQILRFLDNGRTGDDWAMKLGLLLSNGLARLAQNGRRALMGRTVFLDAR